MKFLRAARNVASSGVFFGVWKKGNDIPQRVEYIFFNADADDGR